MKEAKGMDYTRTHGLLSFLHTSFDTIVDLINITCLLLRNEIERMNTFADGSIQHIIDDFGKGATRRKKRENKRKVVRGKK